MKKEVITKDMPLAEVLNKHPETAEIFFKHGMHCLGCVASQFENIEEAAMAHGIDVKKLLADLNAGLKSESKKV